MLHLAVGTAIAASIVALFFALFFGAHRGPAPAPQLEQQLRVPARPLPEPVRVADDGFLARFRAALGKSRAALQGRFDALFAGKVDEALFDDLETTLLAADVGVPTAQRLLDPLRTAAKAGEADPQVLRAMLRSEMKKVLAVGDASLTAPQARPWVILVVGVNGSGKTTTIGKLSAQLKAQGKTPLIAAGDTFRAAAIEQLAEWAARAKVEIVAHQEGADPAAVAFDALKAAESRGCDVVIIDTAGRLQTRKPLMEQLTKIRRVIDKAVPGAPHDTLLVLDGTMGQNALSQAREFHAATPLTGVVVTKLDGTAKGGMILTIGAELGLPVKLIGIGEKIDDLRPFDADAFVDAIS